MKTSDKIIGNLLYCYGMLWYWPFKWFPAWWYFNGRGWRLKIASFVANQFGWTRNQRYEMKDMK